MADWLADGPLDDLNEFGLDTETPLDELEQDTVHRIAEPYGSNPDDRDRGVGADSFLSGTPDLPGLERAIALDLRKDDRIVSLATTITANTIAQSGASYDVALFINDNIDVSTTVGGGS
jgi:hypothetical protein